jgi:hypothetical protein
LLGKGKSCLGQEEDVIRHMEFLDDESPGEESKCNTEGRQNEESANDAIDGFLDVGHGRSEQRLGNGVISEAVVESCYRQCWFSRTEIYVYAIPLSARGRTRLDADTFPNLTIRGMQLCILGWEENYEGSVWFWNCSEEG